MLLKTVIWPFTLPPKKDVIRGGGETYLSPGFPITVKNGDSYVTTVWNICMKFEEYEDDDNDDNDDQKPSSSKRRSNKKFYVNLYLDLITSIKLSIAVENAQFSILDPKNDTIIKSLSGGNPMWKDHKWTGDVNGGFGCAKILSVDDLYDNQQLYFPDGKFFILAAIKFFVPLDTDVQLVIDDDDDDVSVVSEFATPLAPKRRKLIKDLFDSMIEFNPATIMLKLSDGTEMKANVEKLRESSTVFADLLAPKHLSQMKGALEVHGVSREIMRELLRFLYCGYVERMDEVCMDLFKAACEFKVLKLQDLCAKMISETELDVDNVFEVLQLASESQNAKLFSDCCKTIKLCYPYVADTSEWQTMDSRLKIRVLEQIAELTWKNDLVELADTDDEESPELRQAEIVEIHSNVVNYQENLPAENLHYFVKSSSRLRQGQLILVEKLVPKSISVEKFKDFEKNLKILPLK